MKLSAPIYQLKRKAKLLARNEKLPLHEALDRIAREEGFARWSLLSSRSVPDTPERAVLSRLSGGDLLLLGARPGHGKTMLGLRILLDAALEGRRAVFFTLEWTECETRSRIRSLGDHADALGDKLEIVTSEEISADVIVEHLSGSPPGTVAVVDYLQILDQQRSKPSLAAQMERLRQSARANGIILCFISQVDRAVDLKPGSVPGMGDIRLPNPIETGIFSKACFLHQGTVRFHDLA
ncbi:AAA family ATPase [Altererythrobacter soli]|uniref:AAA family ATPase n=1 Tax=Croceibacterium soli TaxID=1739690 RepID=A0A6I4UNQ3_9SPHN|nr:DNA helicase [Croceibacterium soli]MXP40036.1 AAA family ATPase [Croceibacterium soli]